MAKATIIKDTDFSRTIKAADGRVYILEMNEEMTEIIFKYANKEKLGEFIFKDLGNGGYKLMRMYTEPQKNLGIGREALRMFKAHTNDALIYTSPPDGNKREDQSHLTEDAPGFVDKMIKEGFIYGYEGLAGKEEAPVFF